MSYTPFPLLHSSIGIFTLLTPTVADQHAAQHRPYDQVPICHTFQVYFQGQQELKVVGVGVMAQQPAGEQSQWNITLINHQSKRKSSYANGQTNLGHEHKAPDHNHEARQPVDISQTTKMS